MRKASESEYFPYGSKLVCYIELTKDKEIRQIQNYVQTVFKIGYLFQANGLDIYSVSTKKSKI